MSAGQRLYIPCPAGGQAGRGAGAADAGALAGAGARRQGGRQVTRHRPARPDPHSRLSHCHCLRRQPQRRLIVVLRAARKCGWLLVDGNQVIDVYCSLGLCRVVECDLQEVTIEELEVSRPANEARIVAAVDETRAWVDAKTGEVPRPLYLMHTVNCFRARSLKPTPSCPCCGALGGKMVESPSLDSHTQAIPAPAGLHFVAVGG
jgi:hypothetical protein